MLRQPQVKNYKEPKNFEDANLYQKEEESLPIEHAIGWSIASHGMVGILLTVLPIVLLLLGINLSLFNKPKPKMKDIEFVLVSQPEQDPINKNTPLRADRNTRAGGQHDPNKKIAPPQPAASKPSPAQQAKKAPQKQPTKQQPAPQKASQPQKPVQKVQKPVVKPSAPKPKTKPSIPPTKIASDIKLPIPPTKDIPKLSTAPSGPITTKPSSSYSGSSSSATPKPVIASGGYGTGSALKNPSNKGSGAGSAYSPSYGSAGNPGPGNPKGAPGVDAIKEPNFGPYMSELSRRIKANWDPPRGDESKRVVLLFTIAKDGRLLNVKVVKSSGTPAADKAALAAVELTAPFRPLPSEFRGSNIDIQFTFDYNVFGVNSSRF